LPSTLNDLEVQYASVIERIDKNLSRLAEVESALAFNLQRYVSELIELHKKLVSRQREAKVLIALHDGPDGPFRPMLALASTPLRIFLVDHRSNASRSVEIGNALVTETDQYFCEAVHDDLAGFALSSSDLEKIVEQLKS
jgi:hypothetical protein